ncbi:MAG: NAD-dependent DNA ligase LigA, partial [Planctomycetes bacterium]|nr:NAD-dependent DNA ligase LigA [Planctomycetota bacterium]
AWLYSTATHEELGVSSHAETLNTLAALGFPINPDRTVCKTAEEILRWRDAWDEKRHALAYDTDGLVIKVNSIAHQEILGIGSKSPNWAIAYKFAPEQAETIVKNIRVQVGKSGALTPVADLEPVFLSGSTIQHASLHNADEVAKKDIRIGDHVLIEKAGEIIPQVVKSLPEKRDGSEAVFEMPSACPICGSEVVQIDDEVAHRCVNPFCPAQVREKILHFVSRDCMDMDGFGPAVIDQLLENRLIRDVADLFKITKDDLVPLERMAEKSAENLVEALEEAKSRGLARLLTALSIPHVGTTAAQLIAKEFGSIDRLMEASEEEISSIKAGESTSYRTLGGKSSKILYSALREETVRNRFKAENEKDLAKEIESLGLPGFGAKRCKAVADGFGTARKLLDSSERELGMVELGSSQVRRTLGTAIATSLRQYLDSEAGKKLIARLQEAGVSMSAMQTASSTGASGKVFVITGTLEDLGRAEAKNLIEAAGGQVSGSISRSVDYLVAGEKAGSKLTKAQELGVAVIGKEEMLKLCSG